MTTRALRVSDDKRYCAYRSDEGGYELWAGKMSDDPEVGVLVGYFGHMEHFDVAIDAAEEELRCLMAEAQAEFA